VLSPWVGRGKKKEADLGVDWREKNIRKKKVCALCMRGEGSSHHEEKVMALVHGSRRGKSNTKKGTIRISSKEKKVGKFFAPRGGKKGLTRVLFWEKRGLKVEEGGGRPANKLKINAAKRGGIVNRVVPGKKKGRKRARHRLGGKNSDLRERKDGVAFRGTKRKGEKKGRLEAGKTSKCGRKNCRGREQGEKAPRQIPGKKGVKKKRLKRPSQHFLIKRSQLGKRSSVFVFTRL